jgi:hypothetical protein
MCTVADVAAAFPRINEANCEITSPESVLYNCIAWAANDTTRWWQPSDLGGYYWPSSALEADIDDFEGVFRAMAYEVCPDGRHEDGYDKIAIYADANSTPQHVARQLNDGRWTSKLGNWVDITHARAEDLENSDYGVVQIYMRRTAHLPGNVGD